MVDATDVLSGVEIRPSRTSQAGDNAWLADFAKFVRAAYDRAVQGDSLELRALIRQVTRHLRSDDVPPERTVVVVKSLLPAAPRANDTDRLLHARRVRDDAIRWCIVEYYASDESVRDLSHG